MYVGREGWFPQEHEGSWVWWHTPVTPRVTREAEAGGSLWLWGQVGLHHEFKDSVDYKSLYLKKRRKKKISWNRVTERRNDKAGLAKKKSFTVHYFWCLLITFSNWQWPIHQYLWTFMSSESLCRLWRAIKYMARLSTPSQRASFSEDLPYFLWENYSASRSLKIRHSLFYLG